MCNWCQAVIEEFLATAGHNAEGSGSDDDDYKEMLRERLSSVGKWIFLQHYIFSLMVKLLSCSKL